MSGTPPLDLKELSDSLEFYAAAIERNYPKAAAGIRESASTAVAELRRLQDRIEWWKGALSRLLPLLREPTRDEILQGAFAEGDLDEIRNAITADEGTG